jgi:hypothetical protein
MLSKIKAWYGGKFTPYENDPNSSVVILGWDYERHWTSKVAHVVVEFYLREWKWVWGTAFAISGLILALRRVA